MNIADKDRDFVWHPFTQAALAPDNIPVEKASGEYLYTIDGRAIIDAVSSWWVNIHGHSNPRIAAAIADQAAKLEHVIFAGFTHTPAVTLAEKLLAVLPGDQAKIFYSDNGSTAVEVALKMGLQYHYNKGFKERNKILAFENAYHGDTFGAMSVGGRSPFNAPFSDMLFEVHHIPAPGEQNMDSVLQTFRDLAQKGDVAAFIFEPLVQGSGGMLMHKAEHLDMLIAAAKAYGIICIADEVMTGFGRTGTLFASEQLQPQHQPDIICLSKGITGGFLPMGATTCTQQIFDAFYSEDRMKTLFHGHSYTANPIACAAALASLDILLDPACMSRIQHISSRHALFAAGIRKHPLVKDVRQTGTIVAVEVQTPEQSSYFNTIRDDMYKYCLERNVLLRPLGNTIYILPPYCIREEALSRVYEVLADMLDFLGKRYI